ncbi:MAG: hypothetical protein QNI89_14350 [Desulfobacterales bacterium]|nr:hypothetical protein [Desulfobacterales bacterium]
MFNPCRRIKDIFIVAPLALFLIMGLSGCQTTGSSQSESSEAEPAQPTNLYRDFKDILLPGEMKVDDKRTYIVQGPGLTTGILTLKGYVERDSLIDFFKSAMVRDNWTELATFKSPSKDTSSILVFQKADRTAIINIHEESFNTYVEIAVAPMAPGASSGLMGN